MRRIAITVDGHFFEVELDISPTGESTFHVKVNGEEVRILAPNLDGNPEEILCLVIDNRPYELTFEHDLHTVVDYSGVHEIQLRELETTGTRSQGKSGPVKAPIPGQISQILVEKGQLVEPGQALVVLEAMKMQNEIRAQASGIVRSIQVSTGQNVARGDVLIEID